MSKRYDDLNERLKAKGMRTIDEQMEPFVPFQIVNGMNNMDFFEQWLEQQTRQYIAMRVECLLDKKFSEDDLADWVGGKSAALHDVWVNYQAAKAGKKRS